MIFTRRQLLKTGAAWFTALGFGRVTLAEAAKPVTGKILGASAKIGHQLRGGSFPAPSSTTEKETVIIGGGIAGLAAGYRLHKENADFTLLELEPDTGGNAQSGKNNVSAYPWGAH
ncbi:MAG: FAD-dependent oxidoreductase, partial [Alphaproteobacteria bacterium]|nr:FAD-dependent oxidoreductase [Alphaproteobacteria bacterium]